MNGGRDPQEPRTHRCHDMAWGPCKVETAGGGSNHEQDDGDNSDKVKGKSRVSKRGEDSQEIQESKSLHFHEKQQKREPCEIRKATQNPASFLKFKETNFI